MCAKGDTRRTLRPGEQVSTSPRAGGAPRAGGDRLEPQADAHLAILASFTKGMALTAGPLTPLAGRRIVTARGQEPPGARPAAARSSRRRRSGRAIRTTSRSLGGLARRRGEQLSDDAGTHPRVVHDAGDDHPDAYGYGPADDQSGRPRTAAWRMNNRVWARRGRRRPRQGRAGLGALRGYTIDAVADGAADACDDVGADAAGSARTALQVEGAHRDRADSGVGADRGARWAQDEGRDLHASRTQRQLPAVRRTDVNGATWCAAIWTRRDAARPPPVLRVCRDDQRPEQALCRRRGGRPCAWRRSWGAGDQPNGHSGHGALQLRRSNSHPTRGRRVRWVVSFRLPMKRRTSPALRISSPRSSSSSACGSSRRSRRRASSSSSTRSGGPTQTKRNSQRPTSNSQRGREGV